MFVCMCIATHDIQSSGKISVIGELHSTHALNRSPDCSPECVREGGLHVVNGMGNQQRRLTTLTALMIHLPQYNNYGIYMYIYYRPQIKSKESNIQNVHVLHNVCGTIVSKKGGRWGLWPQ